MRKYSLFEVLPFRLIIVLGAFVVGWIVIGILWLFPWINREMVAGIVAFAIAGAFAFKFGGRRRRA